MDRKWIAALLALTLVASTGCVGVVFGDGIDAEASPAAIDDQAIEESSFEYEDGETVEIDETVEAAGQERRVRAVNHVRTYTAEADLAGYEGESATLAVVSTPDVTVLGQSVNPLVRMDHADLLDELSGQLEGEGDEIRDVRHVDEREEPMLGSATTVNTFAGEAEVEGETVTINLHVATVTHEGDVVVVIGAHPEALQQQASEIFELLPEVEHPAEE